MFMWGQRTLGPSLVAPHLHIYRVVCFPLACFLLLFLLVFLLVLRQSGLYRETLSYLEKVKNLQLGQLVGSVGASDPSEQRGADH